MKIFTNIKQDSVRVPAKNFKDFGGVPLYEHTLRKFRDFQFYVDTDSDEIIENCNTNPALSHVTAYKRLDLHKNMENPGILMTQSFLDLHVEDEDEIICVVHVTCPFIEVDTVHKCRSAMIHADFDSACTVNVIRNFCLRKSYHDGNEVKYVPLNFDFRHIPRTQDLEPVYELNHGIFMFTKRSMRKYDNRIGANPYFCETKFPENVDIDLPHDFDMALHILESVQSES